MENQKMICTINRESPDHKILSDEFERLEDVGADVIHTIRTSSAGGLGNHNSNVVIDIRKVDKMYARNTIVEQSRAEQSRAEQSRAEWPSCRIIGQMDNSIDHTFESANRVYDDMGIAPTINTCGGGGLQPKVVECVCLGGFGEKKSNNGAQYYQQDRVYSMGDVALTQPASLPGDSYNYLEIEKMTEALNVKKLGCLEKGTGEHQSNVVYDSNGISPCECAGIGVKQQPTMTVETKVIGKLEENKQIVAMRGRNPENPSDRRAGIELEQRLELNSEKICNTLTSVQKDNLVLETTAIAIDEQNKCVRTETFGCLTTDGSSPKHNNRVGEIAKIKIRQATKTGFIECPLGGGGGFELSNKPITQGQGSREWSSKSDSDNGEYP